MGFSTILRFIKFIFLCVFCSPFIFAQFSLFFSFHYIFRLTNFVVHLVLSLISFHYFIHHQTQCFLLFLYILSFSGSLIESFLGNSWYPYTAQNYYIRSQMLDNEKKKKNRKQEMENLLTWNMTIFEWVNGLKLTFLAILSHDKWYFNIDKHLCIIFHGQIMLDCLKGGWQKKIIIWWIIFIFFASCWYASMS